ncbi:MAG: hypothetical protein IH933_10735 [Euryarchaeota archaeon]|nr:hypothetical protein [Euryarchaeota archaeon]
MSTYYMDIELPAVRPNEETVVDEELPPSTVEYLNYRAIEQNGWDIEDEDLFEKAAEADLDKLNYGVMEVERGETLLRAAEDHGLSADERGLVGPKDDDGPGGPPPRCTEFDPH